MLTIHLHKLRFHAYHGLYEEERALGNDFELTIDIETDHEARIKSINQTLNYVTVYELVAKRMTNPTPLLETLAYDMSEQIYKLDEHIKKISIFIIKVYPPMQNIQGSVGITYCKEF